MLDDIQVVWSTPVTEKEWRAALRQVTHDDPTLLEVLPNGKGINRAQALALLDQCTREVYAAASKLLAN